MDVIVERCAGLDIGKDEVVACVRAPAGQAVSRRGEIPTFPTFTAELERLADWLAAEGVMQVVMEATGQYWKPVWYVLEERGGFELLLVNARHVKILPGRKTDVADAAWLAELLEHGLLRSSFVPPAQIRQLRDLTRYRKRLIQAHSSECQRVQKTLEDALLTELREEMGRSETAAPDRVVMVPPRDRASRRHTRPRGTGGAPARRATFRSTADPFGPFRLVNKDGTVIDPVSAYLQELQASSPGWSRWRPPEWRARCRGRPAWC